VPNAISRGMFNMFWGGKRKPFAALPGPEPGFPLGTLGDFMGGVTAWGLCARYGAEYGGVTLIWLASSPGLVLNDPDTIEQVLDSRRTEFRKGSTVEQLLPTTTEYSLFTARQGEGWEEKRTTHPFEQPWFPAWLKQQVEPMRVAAEAEADALIAAGETDDLAATLRRFTFDVFCATATGSKAPDQVFEDFLLLAQGGDDRLQAKMPLSWVRAPKGFDEAKARFYGYFTDLVKEARANPKPDAVDMLHSTLRAHGDIDDAVLGHTLGLFFFGGAFSGSGTLVGAFHQLQQNAGAAEKLVEAAGALGDDAWTLDGMAAQPWIRATVSEALRILPPVRLFTRSTAEEVEIAGVTLAKDTTIMISNEFLHRDPGHWDEPMAFKPQRWIDGAFERDPLGSGHFFPFGRGPRKCVGDAYSMVFLDVALSVLAKKTTITLASTEPFEEGFFFGVVRPEGISATIAAR